MERSYTSSYFLTLPRAFYMEKHSDWTLHSEAIPLLPRTLRNAKEFIMNIFFICQIKGLNLNEMTGCSLFFSILLLFRGGSYAKNPAYGRQSIS